MNNDFEMILFECKQYMEVNGYSYEYILKISHEWDKLKVWLTSHEVTEFTEEVAFKYCDEMIGSHIIYKGISNAEKQSLRTVNIIIKYLIHLSQ